jgi:hypothetical protein
MDCVGYVNFVAGNWKPLSELTKARGIEIRPFLLVAQASIFPSEPHQKMLPPPTLINQLHHGKARYGY